MYPFKLKINDPVLIKLYLRLEQDRMVKLPPYTSNKITWDLKPIRPNIILAMDGRYNEKWMALKPDLKFKMTPLNKKKTSYKLDFHF